MASGQTVAYISDVGATGIKPLFIAGSAVTVVLLDLAFLSERWLRHNGRLVGNKGRFDKFCSIASIFCGIVGAAGLILLSIFDTLHHHRLHDIFLALFIIGYLISAVFLCLEYWRLGIEHRPRHVVLFVSFWVKVVFVVIEFGLAVAFAICDRHSHRANSAAILEWIIAFIFTFYVLSFIIDLLPAVRTRHHVPQGEKELHSDHSNGSFARNNVTYEEPLTTDSMGENANTYRGQVVNNQGQVHSQNRRVLEV